MRHALLAFVSGVALTACNDEAPAPPAASPSSAAPWLMFHHDERHTGVQTGRGSIDPARGPNVRWTYQMTTAPTEAGWPFYRWYSSFPLGDLDGDGTLEVVVTGPDRTQGMPDSEPSFSPRVVALKDAPNEAGGVRELWSYEATTTHGAAWSGFDQYSAALVDCDGDALVDALFTNKDGVLTCLKGTTGAIIWQVETGYFIEAGPMVSDLDGDGTMEIVLPTDAALGQPQYAGNGPAKLLVYEAISATRDGKNAPIWEREFPKKIDSEEPAIVDLDPNDGSAKKAIILGTWGGMLAVVWRQPDGTIVDEEFDIRKLEPGLGHAPNAVVRSSPLVWNFGQGETAVFGWMPDWNEGPEARVAAVRITADMTRGTVAFEPLWNLRRDDWKSSAALLPLPGKSPLIVTGYGIGVPNGWGTGSYGVCSGEAEPGGVLAVDPASASGDIAWEDAFDSNGERVVGNLRGSPAVADIDGDGALEVIQTIGCFGDIRAYDGATGRLEWSKQLGPRTIGTPSIGDLDNNGTLEIVVGSYDGKVYALGGTR